MADKNDIGFLFDPRPFLNGLTKIDRGLTSFEKNVKAILDKTGNYFTKPFKMISDHLKTFAKNHLGMFKDTDKALQKNQKSAKDYAKSMEKAFKDSDKTILKNQKTAKDYAKVMEKSFKDSSSKSRDSIKSAAEGMQKSMAWAVAKGQMMASAFMAMGKKFVGVVNEQIPEIGQAFGIAKDIIFKNLFWPLRQQIIPMLQKMLDWVRDNRVQFVKMGEVIVGLFKTGYTVAKSFMGALSPLWDALKRLTGFGRGDWMDAVNLALAKVATVAIYVGMLLKPIVGFVANIVDSLANSGLLQSLGKLAMVMLEMPFKAVGAFLESFQAFAPAIFENLKGVADAITSVFSAWSTGNENGDSITTFFSAIGEAAGIALEFLTKMGGEFVKGVASNLKGIMTPLTSIAESIVSLFKGVSGQSDFLGKLFQGLGAGLGMVVDVGLNGLALMVSMLVKTVETLGSFGSILGDIFSGNFDKIPGKIDAIGGSWQKFGEQFQTAMKSAGKDVGNIAAAFIGPEEKTAGVSTGQPDKFMSKSQPAPKKYATGTPYVPKDGLAYLHRGERVVTAAENRQPATAQGNWNVTLNVTEGNARNAGVNFAQGLQYQIRGQLATEAMTGGG